MKAIKTKPGNLLIETLINQRMIKQYLKPLKQKGTKGIEESD